MPNLRDIRKRIRSVKSTQQITRAMKMVSAAKLRRAQERALGARPYAQGLRDILGRVAKRSGSSGHPLLESRTEGYHVLAIVSADRGLCGGFNTNLLKRASKLLDAAAKDGEDMRVYVIGRKARDFFKPRSYEVLSHKVNLFATLTFGNAVIIGDELKELFLNGGARKVTILYNHFKSLVAQELIELPFLPVAPPDDAEDQATGDYLYEPDPDSVLEKLLPLHLHNQVFHTLIESWASEQAARMMAMDNATKNAGEMIDDLTLTLNKIRQAAITRELIEVVSGAGALEEQ